MSLNGKIMPSSKISDALVPLLQDQCLVFLKDIEPTSQKVNPYRISLLRLTSQNNTPLIMGQQAEGLRDKYVNVLQVTLPLELYNNHQLW